MTRTGISISALLTSLLFTAFLSFSAFLPVQGEMPVQDGVPVQGEILVQDDLPPLNREIISYVETVIGQQVDRGECWDLAYQALTRTDAKWDGEYRYGRQVNPKRHQIYPGDLIQFRSVQVRYQEGNTIYTETMDHHTAIVYRVIDDGVFELAHQNTGFSGRTVGISKLDLSTVTSGRMWFYRPER